MAKSPMELSKEILCKQLELLAEASKKIAREPETGIWSKSEILRAETAAMVAIVTCLLPVQSYLDSVKDV